MSELERGRDAIVGTWPLCQSWNAAVMPVLESGRYIRVGTQPLCQRKVSLRAVEWRCSEAGSGCPG